MGRTRRGAQPPACGLPAINEGLDLVLILVHWWRWLIGDDDYNTRRAAEFFETRSHRLSLVAWGRKQCASSSFLCTHTNFTVFNLFNSR